MKFKDLEKCIEMFNNKGMSAEDLENAYVGGFLEDKEMMVDIQLKQEGNSICHVSNAEKHGLCWLTIREGNRELAALVAIDELRIALRKLVAR